MTTYLVDTDWIIDFLKGKQEVVEKLTVCADDGLAVSIISLAELFEGVHASTDPDRHMRGLDAFISGVEVLGVDREIAEEFGCQRARLRKQGRIIDNFDLIIGVSCVVHRLKLFTDNISHFDRIEGLEFG